jgi:hypothetical protein
LSANGDAAGVPSCPVLGLRSDGMSMSRSLTGGKWLRVSCRSLERVIGNRDEMP